IGQLDSLRTELVEVWCLDVRMPETGEVPVTEIVAQDDDEVRAIGGRAEYGKTEQNEQSAESSHENNPPDSSLSDLSGSITRSGGGLHKQPDSSVVGFSDPYPITNAVDFGVDHLDVRCDEQCGLP